MFRPFTSLLRRLHDDSIDREYLYAIPYAEVMDDLNSLVMQESGVCRSRVSSREDREGFIHLHVYVSPCNGYKRGRRFNKMVSNIAARVSVRTGIPAERISVKRDTKPISYQGPPS